MNKKRYTHKTVSPLGLVGVLVCAGFMTACTNSAYEEGDGSLSHTTAEMVDVTINNGIVTGIQTDNGGALTVSLGQTFDEIKNDTVVRCMLYYNKVGQQPIELITYKQVLVLTPASDKFVPQYDPVKLTSIWKANTGKYVNMQVGIMTGKSYGQKQGIALVQDSVSQQGKGRVYYSLAHAQNDLPQYYTQDVYLSIPWAAQDTVSVTITTYDGTAMHTFSR